MTTYRIKFLVDNEVMCQWYGEATTVQTALAVAMFDLQLPDWSGKDQHITIQVD